MPAAQPGGRSLTVDALPPYCACETETITGGPDVVLRHDIDSTNCPIHSPENQPHAHTESRRHA